MVASHPLSLPSCVHLLHQSSVFCWRRLQQLLATNKLILTDITAMCKAAEATAQRMSTIQKPAEVHVNLKHPSSRQHSFKHSSQKKYPVKTCQICGWWNRSARQSNRSVSCVEDWTILPQDARKTGNYTNFMNMTSHIVKGDSDDVSKGGHPWYSDSMLDYLSTGRAVDPMSGAWFITNFISFA